MCEQKITENTNITSLQAKSEGNLGQDEWHIQITVPQDWNRDKDWEYYFAQEGGDQSNDPRPELMDRIGRALADFHGVLDFAFAYLAQGSVEQRSEVFPALPIQAKVELLRKRFHGRERGPEYVKRFDSDLDHFLEVERVFFPILERCLREPETVWLRELLQMLDFVVCAHFDLDQSMFCEHQDCPPYQGFVMINPELLKE